MCSPKCVGGMGFKDLAVFNDALLGRQAWRLVHKEGSLLERVMKAKYYLNSVFLDAFVVYNGSFSWRSVWSSKSLLKEGLIWRIGNGSSVNVWKDPWVADDEGSFVTSSAVEGITNVSDLVDLSTMEWDAELIASVFNARDQKCILSIPLSLRGPKDILTWAFSNDGLYSIKTSYMLSNGCNFDALHLAWVVIWGMDASLKVRHFFWRLCTNTLPTRLLLKTRHMLDAVYCPWCGGADESSSHAIFDCERVQEL